MSEVAKYTPETFRDRITERIRSSYVDLIPEEQWRDLVAKEIEAFTKGARNYGDAAPSPLQAMIRAEINARLLAEVKAFFDSPGCKQVWSVATGGYGAPEFVKSVLAELSPLMIQGFLAQMVAPFFAAISSQVASQINAMSQPAPGTYRNY